TRHRIAVDESGAVVGGELARGPVPDVGRKRGAEGVEVVRVVGPRGRIVRRVLSRSERSLRNGIARGPVVVLQACAELQVRPRAVMDLVGAVYLGPSVGVRHIDVPRSED